MLTKKTIAALAKAAGVEVDELTKAISDEAEKDVELKTKKFFTDEEWETHTKNIDSEKKERYDEGKEVGENQLIRDLKQDVGLTFEGKKKEDFVTHFKTKVLEDADKNPDKRITELEGDLKALKEKTVPEKEAEIKRLSGEIMNIKVNTELESYLPSKLPEGITKKDALSIIKNNLEFSVDDKGNQVVKKDGKILKDEKTRDHIGYKDAVIEFTTERKWRSAEPGREDDDIGKGGLTDPKKARNMGQLEKYWEKNDINPLSEKAKIMITEAAKDAKESKEEFSYEAEK